MQNNVKNNLQNYTHKVNYYETDKMGITHHSNYIRWMEEARIYFLDQIGFGYAKLESSGITSPVIGVECDYKIPTTFDDIVEIKVEVEEFKGVKLIIKYTMFKPDTNEIILTGRTKHCFLDTDNKPIILKKSSPDFDAKLRELAVGK